MTFNSQICEIAATCRGTYDVDHFSSCLTSSEDVAILVECAICLLYRNFPTLPAFQRLLIDFTNLLDRDRRLSHALEPVLHQRIQDQREGLDLAVAAIWTGYHPGSDWQQLNPPNDRWMVTTTSSESGQVSQQVQFRPPSRSITYRRQTHQSTTAEVL